MIQVAVNKKEVSVFSKSSSLLKLGLVTISTFCLVNWCSAQSNSQTATPRYNPNAKYELKITELPYRTNASGRVLKARIYEPIGTGPFPTMIDFHGGAWNNKDRLAEQPMDQAIAKSGVLVVAVDLTLAGDAPYPANLQDASYAIRWVKHHAAQWHGDTTKVGVYGSSSGGHVAQLLALRPNDARYNAIVFEQNPKIDASIAYIATRSPISDPFGRFANATRLKRDRMINNHYTYFKPFESIHEANPQEILERKEPHGKLPPMLLMYGDLDDNVLPVLQEKFTQAYRNAGGSIQLVEFKDSEHEWVAQESAQTDLARKTVKTFIAKQYQK
ncbi:alpha/beta hydrolase [Polynucleobacter kasalickyi]|uniref:Acetyl esterase/lipase n=1 Tax=Polynucleobacter kasalickyi TaxID=1938817 RepID=A0A1W1Y2N1_9BURK|nr:alpha/beta hydrolase [Polynucleobacter kasalickyi]SMC30384.1 Acetyl esterase/lipase [Polynucleobacter kasalickyi]